MQSAMVYFCQEKISNVSFGMTCSSYFAFTSFTCVSMHTNCVSLPALSSPDFWSATYPGTRIVIFLMCAYVLECLLLDQFSYPCARAVIFVSTHSFLSFCLRLFFFAFLPLCVGSSLQLTSSSHGSAHSCFPAVFLIGQPFSVLAYVPI